MPGATTSILGKGTTIGYSVASGAGPYTYTPVGKVQSVAPSITVGEVEDITLDTTFDGYLPTNPAGECTMTIRHRPGDAAVVALIGMCNTPIIAHWKITSVDGSFEIFDGFVKGYSKTFENKSIVDAEVPIRITTAPQFTPAT